MTNFLSLILIFLEFFEILTNPIEFQQKIVNGFQAETGEATFQVFIHQELSFTTWRICGGTLFKSNKVLTAAHCVVPSDGDIYVRYGTLDRSIQIYPDVKVIKFAQHPEYDPEIIMNNDVAVLTLERHIPKDSHVSYSVLRTSEVNINESVTIYGWGNIVGGMISTPEMLQKTTLKVTGTDSQRIFAHGLNSISCQGDSGGAMISSDGKQCGLSSAVAMGCPPGGLNTYMKILPFISWIEQQ